MNIYNTTPYTYLIGWSQLNLWYYGVRYANGCSPDDLWVKYFTSSTYVKDKREKFGEPDIIQVRKTFLTKEHAIVWEEKVINRLQLHKNPNFLNKCCAHAIFHDSEVIEKIRQKAIGVKKTLGYTNEYRIANGMKILTGKPKGSKHSQNAKDERSKKLKGKPTHPNFRKPVGIKHTIDTKIKLQQCAKNRKEYNCYTCNRKIKGTMNWNRHIKSIKHQSQINCN